MKFRSLDNGSLVCDEDPGEPGTGSKRVSITPLEGRFLGFLTTGRRVLEIGTGLGISTDFLACHARRVVTLDVDPWVWAIIWPHLAKNVTPVGHRSRVEGKFDVVFIDARHTTDETEADVAYAKTKITQGMIVVHDANLEEVRYALLDDDLAWQLVPTTHGIGIAYIGWDT